MSSSLNTPLEADYVIIGGGTSGLVLAARLSANDSTRSVIVLEAGKNLIDEPRVQTPALWTTLMGSETDWQFLSTPQVCPHQVLIEYSPNTD